MKPGKDKDSAKSADERLAEQKKRALAHGIKITAADDPGSPAPGRSQNAR